MMIRFLFAGLVLWLGGGTLTSDAWLMPCRHVNTLRQPPSSGHRHAPKLMTKLMPFSEPKSAGSSPLQKQDDRKNGASRKRRRRFWFGAAILALIATLYPSKAVSAAEVITAAAPSVAAPIGTFGGSSVPIISKTMELRLAFRLLYASMVGGFVGWERSSTKHSAGVRTMALVSLGAAAFTICSIYGFAGSVGGRFDPSRMASNVASGVGFIGAGVITTHQLRAARTRHDARLQHSSVVHGLTTAAAIWISAAIGVASGVGLYYIAGTATLSTVAILRFGRVKKLRKRMVQHIDGPSSIMRKQPPLEAHPHVPLPDLVVHAPDQDVQEPDVITSSLTHDLSTWDEEVLKKTATTLVGDGMAHSFRRDHPFDRFDAGEEEYEDVDDDVMEVSSEDEESNVSDPSPVVGEDFMMISAENQTEATAFAPEEEPEFPEILMQATTAGNQNLTDSSFLPQQPDNTPPANIKEIVEAKHRMQRRKDPLHKNGKDEQEVPTTRRTTTEDRSDLSP